MADVEVGPGGRFVAGPGMGAAGVVELRQYRLRPGARDVLVDVFERYLVEPQEALGMRVGGVFRDDGDPDRFVWFRGFADMAARAEALAAFYDGPVWAAHRDVANATMTDSDDVLLLRPTEPARPVPDPAAPRAPTGRPRSGGEQVLVTVYEYPQDEAFTRWLAADVHPVLEDGLGVAVGTWRTLAEPNTYPRLPVREDANVFVWTATFADRRQAVDAHRGLTASRRWRRDVHPRLGEHVRREQRLDLCPTGRSQHPASHRRQG